MVWYNTEHHHSAIRFVTPDQRHRGEETAVLSNRHRIYEAARGASGTLVRQDAAMDADRLGLAEPG